MSQPTARRNSTSCAVSTPSQMTRKLRSTAIEIMWRTSVRLRSLKPRPCRKPLSSLRILAGMEGSTLREEYPAPKSSIDTPNPIPISVSSRARTRPAFWKRAVSVSSNSIIPGSIPHRRVSARIFSAWLGLSPWMREILTDSGTRRFPAAFHTLIRSSTRSST